MEVKLKKEDKEFIDSLKQSSMSDEGKTRLINMVKANRIMMDMILDELDLTKHNSRNNQSAKCKFKGCTSNHVSVNDYCSIHQEYAD